MQRMAPGSTTLSPASHFTSSRSHQRLLKLVGGRTGPGPGYNFSHVSPTSSSSSRLRFSFLLSSASQHDHHQRRSLVVATLKPPSGTGFGKKDEVEKKIKPTPSEFSEATRSSSNSPQGLEEVKDPQYRREDGDDDDVVPEIVTNRMLKRIAFTVGVPLTFALLLFPFFYYLKIVVKLDVPEWLPLVVSMVTFGTAGFGITYGVVSSSWDPAREGSLLGWKEAQVNWPLIWDKFQGSDKKK